jgi:hypothetical protein
MLEVKTKLESTPSAVLDFTDIQTHLRIDGTTDAALVASLISGVTKRVESFLDRKLTSQVWSIYYDYFPRTVNQDAWWDGTKDGAVSLLYSQERFLELPFGPCITVSSVATFDETDGSTAMDASNYSVDTISPRPKIALKSGGVWPSTTLRPVNGVKVTATFGYGTAAEVPQDIKEAIKIAVSNFYEHRGDAEMTDALPKTAEMLLEPYKIWKLK